MRVSLLLLLAALFAFGCASSSGSAVVVPPSSSDASSAAPDGDLLLDGVSILGEWTAVGALDEPEADRDLRTGLLVKSLVLQPDGGATLTGEDRRAETGPVVYDGRVSGDRIEFDGLPGAALIALRSDGRLVLTDPRGRRTIYER